MHVRAQARSHTALRAFTARRPTFVCIKQRQQLRDERGRTGCWEQQGTARRTRRGTRRRGRVHTQPTLVSTRAEPQAARRGSTSGNGQASRCKGREVNARVGDGRAAGRRAAQPPGRRGLGRGPTTRRPQGWGTAGRLRAVMPNPTITPPASRLSRPSPGPPCRHPPGTDHATGRRVQGDVGRGPGGLNYPATAEPTANEQTADKGRPGLVSGLPAPDSETPR